MTEQVTENVAEKRTIEGRPAEMLRQMLNLKSDEPIPDSVVDMYYRVKKLNDKLDGAYLSPGVLATVVVMAQNRMVTLRAQENLSKLATNKTR